MINERLFEKAKEKFCRDIRMIPLFVLPDLQRAVLEGCNAVSGKERDEARGIADYYVKYKDPSLVYGEIDMLRAFKEGENKMREIIGKEKEKVKLSMLVKRQDLQKAMKLICAGEQMMTLAEMFANEAQERLSKRGVFSTEIKNDFGKLAKMLKNINAQVKRVFLDFSPDESLDWAEDADSLENAVREIFKIDIYEAKNFNV